MRKPVYYIEYHNRNRGDHEFRLYNFDIAESKLKPEHRSVLERYILRFLRHSAMHTISLVGMASSTGTEKFNMGLSERRSLAVSSFLLGRGVVLDQFEDVFGGTFRGEGPARTYYGGKDNIEDGYFRAVLIRLNSHFEDQLIGAEAAITANRRQFLESGHSVTELPMRPDANLSPFEF